MVKGEVSKKGQTNAKINEKPSEYLGIVSSYCFPKITHFSCLKESRNKAYLWALTTGIRGKKCLQFPVVKVLFFFSFKTGGHKEFCLGIQI